ncbi:LOW QUALITY PROTEIN: cytochrome P450 2C16-like [Harpia harpyja]|uniref:LOW QUALITY PROTEIN: cytochrome P450 2C16-like n=1 Tax=Harpia harpyja TaxID=202280 RepID=UPI0022B21115|nr:LOW QUALITY PROTEIN: cytochrome P450 2C16-like [Harpia harpyja]
MEPVGTVTTILLILVVMALVVGWKKKWRSQNYPPGPLALPVFRNLLQLRAANTCKTFRKLSEKYGPVFTLHFGSEQAVVVFGYEVVQEVLLNRGDEFTDRGRFPLTEKYNKDLGIFMSNGEMWAQTRRFTLTTLRDFGMGKRSVEKWVQEEMGLLLQELAQTKGQPFNPAMLLSAAMGNTICRILFGERFGYGDEEYRRILRCLAENFRLESSTAGQLYTILPSLMNHLPGSHQTYFQNNSFIEEFLARKVAEHEATLDSAAPRDFVDAFLCRMEQEKGNPGTAFRRDNMHVTVFDMFVSGTESTSITLRYCLMLLLEHPEVAGKVQEEIERVMGREQTPSLQDRGAMPYTEAVLHETLRFLDLVPLGFIRRAKRDTQLGGFIIPKGCTIYPILSSALQDPRHFKNPEAFDPRHFLDEKGGFKKSDAFLPFSAGKLMCLGESLARAQLFLFLTTILQRFQLRHPPGCPHLDLRPEVSGIMNIPRPFELCFCPC